MTLTESGRFRFLRGTQNILEARDIHCRRPAQAVLGTGRCALSKNLSKNCWVLKGTGFSRYVQAQNYSGL